MNANNVRCWLADRCEYMARWFKGNELPLQLTEWLVTRAHDYAYDIRYREGRVCYKDSIARGYDKATREGDQVIEYFTSIVPKLEAKGVAVDSVKPFSKRTFKQSVEYMDWRCNK